MNIFNNEISAAKTTTGFLMKAGQTLTVNFSATGSVDIEYKSSDNWILLGSVINDSAQVANGNMVVRLKITANTGEIDAAIT